MNKKFCFIILIIVLLFVICGVFCYNTLVADNNITESEAEQLCYEVLGEKDEETGFTFSFGVTGAIEKNSKQYYVVRASWLVDNSHLSYIGDFFVSKDGKEIYNGVYLPDEFTMGNIIWRK